MEAIEGKVGEMFPIHLPAGRFESSMLKTTWNVIAYCDTVAVSTSNPDKEPGFHARVFFDRALGNIIPCATRIFTTVLNDVGRCVRRVPDRTKRQH